MKRSLVAATVGFIVLAITAGAAIGATGATRAEPVTKNINQGCNGDDLVYVLRLNGEPYEIEVLPGGCTGVAPAPSLQGNVVLRCDDATDNLLYLLKNGNRTVNFDVVEDGCLV